ncbi:MAG: hypothetical protein ACJA0U_001377 [Salibacteraceae bacterium]|jgi:hypothetical protein
MFYRCILVFIFSLFILNCESQITFKTNFGIGYSQPFYKKTSDHFYTDYSSISQVGGLSIQLKGEINLTDNLSLKIGGEITGGRVSFDYRAGTGNNVFVQNYDLASYRHDLNIYELHIPLMVKYSFSGNGKLTPYLSVGIGYRRHLRAFGKLSDMNGNLVFKGPVTIEHRNYSKSFKKDLNRSIVPKISLGITFSENDHFEYFGEIQYSYIPGLYYYWGSKNHDWYNDEGIYNNNYVSVIVGIGIKHLKKVSKPKI